MAVVLDSGDVKPGDPSVIEAAPPQHRLLVPV
jgi:hypothetical protein